jgi:hypothetical protein
MGDAVVTGTFVAWFVLTVLRQPRWWGSRMIERLDIFNWLPQWGMFGNPTRHDFHIQFRVERRDGSYSSWMPVQVVPDRRPGHWLWNPQIQRLKLSLELVNAALAACDPEGRAQFQRSPRFTTWVRFLASLDEDPHAAAMQIMIVAGRRYETDDRPGVVFLSDFVRIPSDD